MDGVERESRWSEGPRVRVKPRVIPRAGAIRLSTEPLRRDLQALERRFLLLQELLAEGPFRDFTTEFCSILGELGAIGNRLGEMVGRRNITYLVDRRLAILHQYCVWLARRVSAELLFHHQIRLEQELKRLIGPEAYQVYLRLEDVEDAAREVDMLDDRDMMRRLREGTLAQEILEQALGAETRDQPISPGQVAGSPGDEV
ncbi:MAG: hypothetical protein QN131_05365 [Armatimonadota bacterium]|nr:hypothetical protein [Armatimonadota bacterium]MDR7549356.1 hypothetical protein [Armatimonadota bacterium]